MTNEEYDFTKVEISEYIKIIEDKSNYINELIDDLNLSTRLKNKALTLNLKNINIVSLVRGVVMDILNNPKTSSTNIELLATREVIARDIVKAHDDVINIKSQTEIRTEIEIIL